MKALPILEINEQDTFKQMLQRLWQLVVRIINGRISFGDGTNQENIDGQWKRVVTPAAPNTDFSVTHGLGRIPIGYILVRSEGAGLTIAELGSPAVYDGSVAWTDTTMSLRSPMISIPVTLFII